MTFLLGLASIDAPGLSSWSGPPSASLYGSRSGNRRARRETRESAGIRASARGGRGRGGGGAVVPKRRRSARAGRGDRGRRAGPATSRARAVQCGGSPLFDRSAPEGAGWSPARQRAGGKSGHRRAGCWLTARGGDPTDSATESRPPRALGRAVRVKRCGKSAPAIRVTGSARQTPPGARPNRRASSRQRERRAVRSEPSGQAAGAAG